MFISFFSPTEYTTGVDYSAHPACIHQEDIGFDPNTQIVTLEGSEGNYSVLVTDKPIEPTPVTIPEQLTPRQVRLAMIGAGINLSDIDTMIDSLEEPEKSQVRVMWEYSNVFLRDDPVLNSFAEQLSLTQEDIDNLFITGSQL